MFLFSHISLPKQTPHLNMTCEPGVYFPPLTACVFVRRDVIQHQCQLPVSLHAWPAKALANIPCRSRNSRWQPVYHAAMVCVPTAPISTWPPLHMSPAPLVQKPAGFCSLLAVTSHLPTPGASSYISPPADCKSVWFYCQGGFLRATGGGGRLAGDMGQMILKSWHVY